MYFDGKSKMVASSHGSRRMTTKEVLDKVFADRVKLFWNIITTALALKMMMKAVKESKVSGNITARVLVKTAKVERNMRHLKVAKEEEEVVQKSLKSLN